MYSASPLNGKLRGKRYPSAEYQRNPRGPHEDAYDYDGGPEDPVPMADPKPRRKVPGDRRDVSLRRGPVKWIYRGYGR
jgi:hypothetical protein